MSFNAKQKKVIAGKIVEVLDLMFPEGEELEEEELEEEEELTPAQKKKAAAAKKKKAAAAKKKGPTLNEVRKAMRQFSKDFGKDEAKELLEPYDAKSLSAVDEDDYQSLLDDIAAYDE